VCGKFCGSGNKTGKGDRIPGGQREDADSSQIVILHTGLGFR
jgi:hypothetical protein